MMHSSMENTMKRAVVLPVLLVVALLVPGAGAAPAVDSSMTKRPVSPHAGIDLRAEVAAAAKIPAWTPRARLAPPASYDLSRYAPPVGNQGPVASCVAWGVAYGAVSLLMNRQGIDGAPMAPMYVYAQIARGYPEQTTTIPTIAQMLVDQGVETRSLYWQGDYDYTTQPTAQQRTHAANFKISGYDRIAQGAGTRHAIKTAIAAGRPVVFSFEVRESFEHLDDENSVYAPGTDVTDPSFAGHVVAIVGYDENGVRVLNSWGVDHGADGYFTTSWSTLEARDQVKTIYALRELAQD